MPLSSSHDFVSRGGNSATSTRRNVGFLLLLLSTVIRAWAPLTSLFKLSFQDARYTHIMVIPIISASMIYLQRKAIFGESLLFPTMALPLIILELISFHPAVGSSETLSIFAFVLIVIAGFAVCYGRRAVTNAIFPLSFLLLMIPLPTGVLDQTILALQEGTSELTYILIKMLGVPVFRQGIRLSLPGVDIEIAAQCSGIRSSIALFITALLAGQFFLRSGWCRVSLTLLVIPIAILKNAVRIATISCLGVYVNVAFLYGRLHRNSGLAFAPLALAMFVPLVFAFYKLESHHQIRQHEDRAGTIAPSSPRRGFLF